MCHILPFKLPCGKPVHENCLANVNVTCFYGYTAFQVAKSRKELVDKMAIEKQTTDANHKEQLDKLQEDYKVCFMRIERMDSISEAKHTKETCLNLT